MNDLYYERALYKAHAGMILQLGFYHNAEITTM